MKVKAFMKKGGRQGHRSVKIWNFKKNGAYASWVFDISNGAHVLCNIWENI